MPLHSKTGNCSTSSTIMGAAHPEKQPGYHIFWLLPWCWQPMCHFLWQRSVSLCSTKICCYNSSSCCAADAPQFFFKI